ncbi:hypothetical protein J7E50_21400 [Pedobacter sp. ISL-68]|uniref:hypothetical protein n=1 Tax=unclassified Pedobacter TaxID=2628915 RepID=UPI001BEBD907|nr:MULTISPECIES: hypothetical protein [unclassified Pedobacter]MBT2563805.1 hypothetical protein [Pedobacter sp. ISL-64]MBT2592789.1 hypothetical protein [Pedobacter sp. ISL-68]
MRFGYVMLVALLFSCKAKDQVAQLKDDDLTVMAIRNSQATEGETTFQVRVFPSKVVLENGSNKLTEEMFYRSDSCMYLLHGDKKDYPLYIEPVSNGVKGSYEFLVAFNKTPNQKSDTLIYHDKFINQKKYVLAIK